MKKDDNKITDYTLFRKRRRVLSDMVDTILKSAEFEYDRSNERFKLDNSDKLFNRKTMITILEEARKQVRSDTYTNPIVFQNKEQKIEASLLNASILSHFIILSIARLPDKGIYKTADEIIEDVTSKGLQNSLNECVDSNGRIDVDTRSLDYVKDILETGILKLEINLSATSKEQIEKEFSILLHNINFLRDVAEILKLDVFKKGRRRRARNEDLWDLKYKAWELKRTGKTYEAIAEILFPGISKANQLDQVKASIKKYVKEMNIIEKRIKSRLHKVFQESQTK